MPRLKVKLKSEQTQSTIKALEDIVNDIDDEVGPSEEELPETSSKRIGEGYMDNALIRADCKRKAERFVNSLVRFYLAENLLNDTYLRLKVRDDKNTLTDLLYNMKAADHSIAKLVEVIDEGGAIVPRNFEVLSRLQSTKMEIVKHYEAVKNIIENNYKSMRLDYEEKLLLESGSEDGEGPNVAGVGHRALLKDLAENMELNTDFNSNKENVIKSNMIVPNKRYEPSEESVYEPSEESVYEPSEESVNEPDDEIKLPKGVRIYDQR